MQVVSNIALWLLVFVTLGRFQELFPFFTPLQLGKVSIALGLLVIFVTNVQDIGIFLSKSNIKKYLLIILVIAFFGIPFSVYPGDAISKYLGYLRLLLGSSIIVALGRRNIENFQLCLISVLFLISMQMLAQTVDGRISVSSTYDPNDIALLCVVYLPFAVHGITKKGIFIKAFSIATTACAVGSIALTGSRGGLLALVGMTIYAIILAKKRRILLICISLIGASIFASFAGDALWERIQSLIDGTDYNLVKSGDSRLGIWGSCVELLIRRPIFGVGIGQIVTGLGTLSDSPWKTAHNSFLQIGVELGILGLFAFCAMLYTMHKFSIQASKAKFLSANQQALYTFFRMSIIGFCIGGFFVSHAYSSITYVMFCMGTIMFLDYQKKEAFALQNEYEQSQEAEATHIENAISEGAISKDAFQAPAITKEKNGIHTSAEEKRKLKKAQLEAGDALWQNKKKAENVLL